MKARLLAAALVAMLCNFADAHAFLDHADPKVGSTVSESPSEVKIWFTESIEPTFSTLQVFDSDNKKVDRGDAHLDANDKTLFIVSVPTLPPGEYVVRWAVVASDTHKTHGDFKFTMKASS